MINRLAYIFGDSVMKGVVLDEKTESYKTLEPVNFSSFEKRFDLELVNRSRFGSTIQKGLPYVKQMVERDPEMGFAVLEFGGNDCDFDWKAVSEAPDLPHKPKTPPELFRKLYIELLDFLKGRGITPIMMNLPPVDGVRYLDFLCKRGLDRSSLLKFLKDPGQISRFQELYSITIERIAHETNTLLVDCRSAFLNKLPIEETICADGIHPTNWGHKLIYDSFTHFIQGLPIDIQKRLLGKATQALSHQ